MSVFDSLVLKKTKGIRTSSWFHLSFLLPSWFHTHNSLPLFTSLITQNKKPCSVINDSSKPGIWKGFQLVNQLNDHREQICSEMFSLNSSRETPFVRSKLQCRPSWVDGSNYCVAAGDRSHRLTPPSEFGHAMRTFSSGIQQVRDLAKALVRASSVDTTIAN